ncbi:MAG: chromosomal replication initiator protein DnaA [Pirellulales bacterium]
MVKDDIDILSALQLALIDKIGQQRYDLWFESNTSMTLVKNQLYVEATSQVTLDFIRKNFRTQIDEVVSATVSNPVVIQYRVSAKKPEANTKPQATAAHQAAPNKTANRPSSGMAPKRQFAKFSTLVTGPCNNMAVTAAKMVLNQPGQMSPLFLFGPQGCGKTHLLEAIYCEARRTKRTQRVVYLSAEQFTTFFLSALQGTGIANFRRKYRDADLLIIDDVQFFAGKKATRTELIHTIDAIVRRGGQIVFTSDKRPTDLTALGPELIARFSGGLVCQVEELDRETRKQYSQQLAQQRGMDLQTDVLDWLADNLLGDARAVSGALNRLWASSVATGKRITRVLAEQSMADLIEKRTAMVRLSDVEQAVCKSFGIDAKLLQCNSRTRKASHPRMLAMWLARKHTRAALSEICTFFNRKSHSTVISAEKKINQLSQQSQSVQLADLSININEAIRQVEAELKQL